MLVNNNKITAQNFTGWKPCTKINNAAAEKLNEIIEQHAPNSIAISGHKFYDADSISSCFAMAHLLYAKLKKPIDVYLFGTMQKKYAHLNLNREIRLIQLHDKICMHQYRGKKYDLAISLDTASKNQIDREYFENIFQKAKITFKIDHHPANSDNATHYANYEFTDSQTPSASQLVMQLVRPFGINPKKLPKCFNNAVYTGILGDTGFFANTNSRMPFQDTALLITNGLKPNYVSQKLNTTLDPKSLEILNKAKQNILHNKKGNIYYYYLTPKTTEEIAKLDNAMDVVERLKSIVGHARHLDGVEAVLFIRNREDELYFSIRSKNLNVGKFAAIQGGGGHDLAAGFNIPKSNNIHKTILNVVKNLEYYLENIKFYSGYKPN